MSEFIRASFSLAGVATNSNFLIKTARATIAARTRQRTPVVFINAVVEEDNLRAGEAGRNFRSLRP